jgi:glycosyltransferase involved in cell wall biosynthesis
MRILVVTNMFPSTGRPSYGSFVKSQVDSLTTIGHTINVLFIDGSLSKRQYLAGFGAVTRAIRQFEPDLVHAHYGLTGFVAAYPRHPQRLVLSLCGDDVLGTPKPTGGLTLRSQLGRGLTRLACARADAIVVKSEEMREVVVAWGYRNVTTIPNGVDVGFFKPASAAERHEARRRLGLAPDRIHVLFPHTPYELRKRVDLAQQVAAALGPAAELQVVYHQTKEVLRDYYYASDIMILTSEWEGSPNVVKEAMACDLPTVSFDVGDVRWLAVGTEAHRVVPRHNISAMVREIRDLVKSGVRDGSDRIRRDLSATAVAQRITGIYDALPTPK